MASVSYLQKLILVSARQNLSSSTTAIQCHLETVHMEIIPNFQNSFGVKKVKLRNLILNGPFLKKFLDQNCAIFAPGKKASNKQFQREGEITKQIIKSCVEMQAWK